MNDYSRYGKQSTGPSSAGAVLLAEVFLSFGPGSGILSCSFYPCFFQKSPKFSHFLPLKFLFGVKVSSSLLCLLKRSLISVSMMIEGYMVQQGPIKQEETRHYLVQAPHLSDEENEDVEAELPILTPALLPSACSTYLLGLIIHYSVPTKLTSHTYS